MANYLQDVIRAIGCGDHVDLGYYHPLLEQEQPAYPVLPTSGPFDELTRNYLRW